MDFGCLPFGCQCSQVDRMTNMTRLQAEGVLSTCSPSVRLRLRLYRLRYWMNLIYICYNNHETKPYWIWLGNNNFHMLFRTFKGILLHTLIVGHPVVTFTFCRPQYFMYRIHIWYSYWPLDEHKLDQLWLGYNIFTCAGRLEFCALLCLQASL